MSDLLKLAGVGVLALGLIGSSGGAPRKPDGTIDPAAAVAKGWETTTGGLSAEGAGGAVGNGVGSAVDSGASQISNNNLGRGVVAGSGLIVAGGVAAGLARGLGNMGRPVGNGIKERIKNGPTIVEPHTPVTAAPPATTPPTSPPVTDAPRPPAPVPTTHPGPVLNKPGPKPLRPGTVVTLPAPPPVIPPWSPVTGKATPSQVEDSPWAFCPQPIGVRIEC
ncbi:MAG: hypothetical protein ACRCW4_17600 [Candidatus Neomicrothrix subdominans]